MHPTPSTKIPFRDIKDHADLMDFTESLMSAKVYSIMYGWNNRDEIAYFKSEIAHFLRIQSAQPGVAVEGHDDVFHQSGASADSNVRKNS